MGSNSSNSNLRLLHLFSVVSSSSNNRPSRLAVSLEDRRRRADYLVVNPQLLPLAEALAVSSVVVVQEGCSEVSSSSSSNPLKHPSLVGNSNSNLSNKAHFSVDSSNNNPSSRHSLVASNSNLSRLIPRARYSLFSNPSRRGRH